MAQEDENDADKTEAAKPVRMSTDVRKRIEAALAEKVPTLPACYLCGETDWVIAGGFTSLALTAVPLQFATGGLALPSVAMVCFNCGNTLILNLNVLDLQDLIVELQEEDNTRKQAEKKERREKAGAAQEPESKKAANDG